MKRYQRVLSLLSRIFIAGIFVHAGLLGKILFFNEAAMFTQEYGMPYAKAAVAIALVIELLGAVLLIIGWQAKRAAWVLAIYLIIVTFIFHGSLEGPQQVQFLKNFAIIGGLMMVGLHGSGGWALDKKRK